MDRVFEFTDIKEAIDKILWVNAAKGTFIKRTFLDKKGVYIQTITLEKLLHHAMKGGFIVQVKRETWLGDPGDKALLLFE